MFPYILRHKFLTFLIFNKNFIINNQNFIDIILAKIILKIFVKIKINKNLWLYILSFNNIYIVLCVCTFLILIIIAWFFILSFNNIYIVLCVCTFLILIIIAWLFVIRFPILLFSIFTSLSFFYFKLIVWWLINWGNLVLSELSIRSFFI